MDLSGLRFEQPTVDTSRLGLPDISFEQPTARTTRARDPISKEWVLKTGAGGAAILFADRVAVTEEVPEGGVVDVEVEVVNAASRVSPDDPDRCREDYNAGYEYTVTANPSWTDGETETVCHGNDGLVASSRKTRSFSFTAPSESGSEELEVTIEMVESGAGNSESYSVAVSGDGSDGDSDIRPGPGDGDESTGDGPLDGLLGDGDLLSGLSGPVALLVVILLLFIIGSVAFRASPLGILLD